MADKSIRAPSAAVQSMSADWEMIDALMDGTVAMRLGGRRWLPKFPQESEDSYKDRLETAVLHPVFKRTVLVNASRPFSRAMNIGDETPAQVVEWSEDIDLQGTPFAAFSLQVMAACLSKGLFGVLVDFPKAGANRTKAEEDASGSRPYCVQYPANSILGWKTALGPEGLRLSQLRLLEFVEVDDGDYGTKVIEQVRVLTPGAWQTWRTDEKDKTVWNIFESGVNTIDFIPFVFFYGTRKGFGIGASPLRDLAYQNVEHWQSASDQQTILHVARVPILFGKCMGDGAVKVGPGSLAQSSNEKAELKYVEHSGAAINAGKDSLTALEERMRSTGAELISLKPGFATATEVSSDGEATKSLLQQICENFEESAEEVLEYMAAWVKLDQTAEVELYKDFGVASSTDPSALSGAKTAGAISAQTHFEELQRRDVLSQDRTWEDEQKRIATDSATAVKNAEATAKATAAGKGE